MAMGASDINNDNSNEDVERIHVLSLLLGIFFHEKIQLYFKTDNCAN